MSVIYVVLGFVLVCLVLVHLNLHQKKREFYEFIQKTYKTLIIRHKKIEKLLKLVEKSDLTEEIRMLNNKIIEEIKNGEILPSRELKAEILIGDKMKTLIKQLEALEQKEEITLAIESYKKTQKKLNKNKQMYNKLMSEFMEACEIKPAALFATFEKIDIDYPKLITE